MLSLLLTLYVYFYINRLYSVRMLLEETQFAEIHTNKKALLELVPIKTKVKKVHFQLSKCSTYTVREKGTLVQSKLGKQAARKGTKPSAQTHHTMIHRPPHTERKLLTVSGAANHSNEQPPLHRRARIIPTGIFIPITPTGISQTTAASTCGVQQPQRSPFLHSHTD